MSNLKFIISGVEQLSLGISMVVAVLLGFGFGYWVKVATGWGFAVYIGSFMGVAAAILNVYKAYKKQLKSLDELSEQNRFSNLKKED